MVCVLMGLGDVFWQYSLPEQHFSPSDKSTSTLTPTFVPIIKWKQSIKTHENIGVFFFPIYMYIYIQLMVKKNADVCVCYCRSLPQHTGHQHSSEKLRVFLQCQPHHADHRQDHGLPLRHSGLRCPWWQPDKSVLFCFFYFSCQLLIVLSYFKACCLAKFIFV